MVPLSFPPLSSAVFEPDLQEREREGIGIVLADLARGLALVSLPSKTRAVEGLAKLPERWEAEHQKRAAARCLGFRVISQQESPGGPQPTNRTPNCCHFTTHRITHLTQMPFIEEEERKILAVFPSENSQEEGLGLCDLGASI